MEIADEMSASKIVISEFVTDVLTWYFQIIGNTIAEPVTIIIGMTAFTTNCLIDNAIIGRIKNNLTKRSNPCIKIFIVTVISAVAPSKRMMYDNGKFSIKNSETII